MAETNRSTAAPDRLLRSFSGLLGRANGRELLGHREFAIIDGIRRSSSCCW